MFRQDSPHPNDHCIQSFFFSLLFLFFIRVLQLMNLTDSQLSQRGSEKLELAILSFFEQFRKMYVGDQAQKTSKVKKK